MPTRNRNVLIVDPDAAQRAAVIEMLADLPINISEATDGLSALGALASGSFRLVITDLYIRTGSSECLVRAIRANKKHRSTRVLVHTSHSERADHLWARNSGATGLLLRPVLRDRLRNAVRRLTSRGTTFDATTASGHATA